MKLSYEDACRNERDLFFDLMTGGQAQALQYAFFAERAAMKVRNICFIDEKQLVRKAVMSLLCAYSQFFLTPVPLTLCAKFNSINIRFSDLSILGQSDPLLAQI